MVVGTYLAKLIATTVALSCLCTSADGQRVDGQTEAEITVTASSISGLRSQLKDCLKSSCETQADIVASLRLAQAMFVDGAYRDSLDVLRASADRQRASGKAFPRDLAALYHAWANVASHMGERELYDRGADGMIAALRSGLAGDDPALLKGELEFARMELAMGNLGKAFHAYATVAKYRGKQQDVFNAAAFLGIAVGLESLGREDQAQKIALHAVDCISPACEQVRMAANLVIDRLSHKTGSLTAASQSSGHVRSQAGSGPMLLYNPPLVPDGDKHLAARIQSELDQGNAESRWADIKFHLGENGAVDQVEVVREHKSEPWIRPVLEQIRSRVYAPWADSANYQGIYRLERYTLTAFWTDIKGSRIRQRSPERRLEMLDMSNLVDEHLASNMKSMLQKSND